MKKSIALFTIACFGATIGCQKPEKRELAAVPPPAEPVQVQQYEPTPVQFEPVQPAAQPGAYAAPTPAPAVAPMPAAQSTYTIQKGDSLWKIAERHYGNGQRWPDIVAANPGLVPERMPVGKTIVLP